MDQVTPGMGEACAERMTDNGTDSAYTYLHIIITSSTDYRGCFIVQEFAEGLDRSCTSSYSELLHYTFCNLFMQVKACRSTILISLTLLKLEILVQSRSWYVHFQCNNLTMSYIKNRYFRDGMRVNLRTSG